MKLSQLLDYNNIIVQSHNNPDADSLAAGMALTKYLKDNGKNVFFVYGGNFEIKKSNLKLMVSDLGIEVHHIIHQAQLTQLLKINHYELPDLIITIDSQYGEGNVQEFKAKNIATIDHHQLSAPMPELSEIRSYQASCSTIIWDMLRDEGIDVNEDANLATALYYGLMTDSNNFSEIHHPLDMDMRDELKFSSSVINKFKNANISQEELRIAGIALLGSEYYKDNHYSIVKADPCDPNILGIISDMLIEVEDVECCLAYTIHDGSIKLSVRSCVKEVKADELAKFICEGVGNGGGHMIKAGGSIIRSLLEKQELDYTATSIHQFFRERMKEYFLDNDIIYANDYSADISTMTEYKSRRVTVGCIKTTELLEAGTKALVRSVEGDFEFVVSEDLMIVIGVRGEVYVTPVDVFSHYYTPSEEPYVYPGDYLPTIRNLSNGQSQNIIPRLKSGVFEGVGKVYAKELYRRTKVFTKQDPEKYKLGRPGDYMVVSANDRNKIYIVDRDLFNKTYESL